MLKRLKKEWAELKSNNRHLNDESEIPVNPSDNFEKLVQLSTRTNPRFKIIGDNKLFTIIAKSDNIGIGICILILLFFPAAVIYLNPTSLGAWIAEMILIIIILLFFRYYPSTNNIEVDSNIKTLYITSNNLIGRFIIPPLQIEFATVKEFRCKTKSFEGASFNRVYIHFNDQKKAIIDLPNGPFYIVNPKIFMENLSSLIKNSRL